jgi:type I restriction enzyme R subunit
MWITGFDVPSLSTMYIDKPLKAHTLMQAIARANRINEGKNNGLIVDYIETYNALLDALAIYGAGGSTDGTSGGKKTEPPVKPNEELIEQLEEALAVTETFLKDEVDFDLYELVNAVDGLTKLAAIDKGINAVYTNDETKLKFQVLAREVFKKYKALQPNKVLNEFAPRKNAIDAIYTAIEDKIENADVSEIMSKIQEVVNKSIVIKTSEPGQPYANTLIDLSGLNFDLLEKYFVKAKNKNTLVQSLKDKVERQLKYIVDRNPLMIDYLTRYQEIIDDYNKGKDENVIKDTFRKLIDLINNYTEEEAVAKREGLNDEQKAIFDILRQGKTLTEKEKKEVKSISVSLLEELKQDKLNIVQWWEKVETSAAVYRYVNDSLFRVLPYPTYEENDIVVKTNQVFEHLKSQYYGGGRSVYGGY